MSRNQAAQPVQEPQAPESAGDTGSEIALKLRAVFDEEHAKGTAEDGIKMAMVMAGATFKNVTRLYNEFMISAGHVASKDEREQIVLSAVEGKALDTEDGFNQAVQAIVVGLKGSNEKSAASLVRGHAKKLGLTVYKKERESLTGRAGRSGFTEKFYAYLRANPACTKEQATAFVTGKEGCEETSENTIKRLPHFLHIWQLVSDVYNQAQPKSEQEAA